MHHRCLTLSLAFILFFVAPAAPIGAQSKDEAKTKEIVRLLQLTNVLDMMDQMSGPFVEALVKEIRTRNPKISDKTIKVFREEFTRSFKESNREMLAFSARLYDKYFSRDDIKVMLQLLQEVIKFAQSWGPRKAQETFEKVSKNLKSQGYEI
jgi:hypothetical protein